MIWYKKLTINQKINLKDCCEELTGITWDDMGKLFNFRERINILYDKLRLEGFDI